MKKTFDCIKNNIGQALVEYVFFTLVLLMACYGVIKLFISAWKNKFEFLSGYCFEILNALF